ncbi:MAG TPA: tetraacyldisaccharide 4'-kinase [Pyrinomonadaceae bacterium]|nr:tetraacyldisaccharide 4'-kinase [Pyrinomonadaceae bacterium]
MHIDLPTLLAPLGVAYGAAVRARLALYRAGVFKCEEVGAPVLSVGNVTAGGTGKTPLVEWVARAVAREGRRACVLTRGYGRADVSARVIVSNGERVLAGAKEAGDEPRLLAESLLAERVAVVSDADRVAAARWALRELGSEVFVLDDGFQHLRIARDLDLVTVDALAPWGGRRLLPRGRLREPLPGLARADALVITRADLAPDLASLRDEARRLSGGKPVFAAHLRTLRTRLVRTSPAGADETSEARADDHAPEPHAAFCGLGNPEAFFAHLRLTGRAPAYKRAFPDHHTYTQADLDALSREAARRGARSLLTTAKDAVKFGGLTFALPCYAVDVALEVDEEDGLLRLVRAAIRRR